jgi:threonine/homoserine/homoserine lactone efflux protein
VIDLISGPTLLAYVGLVLAIAIAPGPNVLFVMTQSAWRGPQAGLFAAAGVESANLVYVLCSAAGLASLIAASGTMFEVIKWAGAAYLLWLGFKAIRSSFRQDASPSLALGEASARAYRDGLMVGAGNPKTILFFLALFPQFIDPARTIWLQSLVLGALAVFIDFLIQLLYIAIGGALSRALSRGPVKRWFERGIGGAFLGLATAAALAHRA